MFNIEEEKVSIVKTSVKYKTEEAQIILNMMVDLFDEEYPEDLLLTNKDFAEEFFYDALSQAGFLTSDCQCYSDEDDFISFDDLPKHMIGSVFEYFFTKFCTYFAMEKEW